MSNEEKEMAVAMRAGFTLIEILVAVAIIGILGAVAVVNVTANLETSRATAAQEAVNNIKNAITSYSLKYKKNPTSLQDLVKEDSDGDAILDGGEGVLEDPWGVEYRMETKGNGKKFVIISNGPDREPNTEDDIRSDKIKKSKKD